MHVGLICSVFCLSVTGMCAHFNVKLLHFTISFIIANFTSSKVKYINFTHTQYLDTGTSTVLIKWASLIPPTTHKPVVNILRTVKVFILFIVAYLHKVFMRSFYLAQPPFPIYLYPELKHLCLHEQHCNFLVFSTSGSLY